MTMTFLGIPVEGDITKSGRVAQRPLEDLAPIMQALLDDEGIARFGWRQYTPYFNDGDACVFSARGVWAARPEDLDPEDPDTIDTGELDIDYGSRLGGYEGGEWVPDPENAPLNKLVGARYEGPDQARYDRCRLLSQAIESGRFDDVLLDAFGDHAEITVTREGITVESYEHD